MPFRARVGEKDPNLAIFDPSRGIIVAHRQTSFPFSRSQFHQGSRWPVDLPVPHTHTFGVHHAGHLHPTLPDLTNIELHRGDCSDFFSDPPSVFPFDRAEEPSQIALHSMPGPLTNKTGPHLLDETITSGCPDDFRRERRHT
jgi:hypothetical protein